MLVGALAMRLEKLPFLAVPVRGRADGRDGQVSKAIISVLENEALSVLPAESRRRRVDHLPAGHSQGQSGLLRQREGRQHIGQLGSARLYDLTWSG